MMSHQRRAVGELCTAVRCLDCGPMPRVVTGIPGADASSGSTAWPALGGSVRCGALAVGGFDGGFDRNIGFVGCRFASGCELESDGFDGG